MPDNEAKNKHTEVGEPLSRGIALITGLTGQDGSYLAEFLLEKDYKVYGLVRNVRDRELRNISHLAGRFEVVEGSIEFFQASILNKIQPTEIYNLAAQSFVGQSWEEWQSYQRINGEGAVNIFESARRTVPNARIYQASSSEMFGNTPPPQSEESFMAPRSPYGASKLYAHNMARIYRESYDMHISCGICFNHESPRRGHEFVSRKIASEAAKISKHGGKIVLGNLVPKRDWGHAKDYVEAMWMMLQAPEPGDYVVATGETHSVEEFLNLAFAYVGLNWKDYYEINEAFLRPAEVYDLCGDSTKIREELGWEPKYSFEDLVRDMVISELEELRVHDEQQRKTAAPVLGELQSHSGSEAVLGRVPGGEGRSEESSARSGSQPPNVSTVG
jgi:GDPmannose 4,6-dehydratase